MIQECWVRKWDGLLLYEKQHITDMKTTLKNRDYCIRKIPCIVKYALGVREQI